MLAAASLLALDVGDRAGFEKFRSKILKSHTEYPMMWTFSAFLVDRYHAYWLFQVPFTAEWCFNRRKSYFMTQGHAEAAQRMLRAELQTEDGKALHTPELDAAEALKAAILQQTGSKDGSVPAPGKP